MLLPNRFLSNLQLLENLRTCLLQCSFAFIHDLWWIINTLDNSTADTAHITQLYTWHVKYSNHLLTYCLVTWSSRTGLHQGSSRTHILSLVWVSRVQSLALFSRVLVFVLGLWYWPRHLHIYIYIYFLYTKVKTFVGDQTTYLIYSMP